MIVLSRDQLEHILTGLSEYYPRSLQLDTMIRNKLTGHVWPGTEIVADAFPDYAVLMCRPVKDSQEYVAWPLANTNGVSIFCRDPKKLDEVVGTADFVDWTKPTELFAVSRHDVYPAILRKCAKMPGFISDFVEDIAIVHLLHPSHLVKSDPPEGFRLSNLSEEHAEQVNREWRHGSPGTLPFFKYLLRTNKSPSSAVFTADGRLVAYILSTEGLMFHGYVVPEYRNKGLYQVVNYDLASKLVSLGQPCAWLYVVPHNKASLGAYHKLGAKKIDPDEYSVAWYAFAPPAKE